MKFPCKVWPAKDPAFSEERFHWAPLINVRLIYGDSAPSKLIECLVDSGAHACLFDASLCHPLGIKRVEHGIPGDLKGIISGPKASLYYHKIKVLINSEQFETMAGFSPRVSVAGILGRRGFFENFVVTIDSSVTPPVCNLQRIRGT